ncbi:transcription-repair coupling factor [Thermosulfuriphilus sp.]
MMWEIKRLNPLKTWWHKAKGEFGLLGTRGTSAWLILALLESDLKRPVLVVLADQDEARKAARDLAFFMEAPVFFFPTYDAPPFTSLLPEPESAAGRVATLYQLKRGPRAPIVVVPVAALLRRTIPWETLSQAMEYLLPQEEIPREPFLRRLIEGGYQQVGLVQGRGEVSVRGGVIDLFPPQYPEPIRLDFWGDILESIRLFDPISQRSLESLEEAVILPASELFAPDEIIKEAEARVVSRGEKFGASSQRIYQLLDNLSAKRFLETPEHYLPLLYSKPETIFDYLAPETVFILYDPPAIEQALKDEAERIRAFAQRAKEDLLVEAFESFVCPEEFWRKVKARPRLKFSSFRQEGDQALELDIKDLSDLTLKLKAQAKGSLEILRQEIAHWIEDGERVILASPTERTAERLKGLLESEALGEVSIPIAPAPLKLKAKPGVEIVAGGLSRGFYWPELALVIISEEEILGIRQRPLPRRSARERLLEELKLEELHPGDLVVHRDHGIGRYEGLIQLDLNGIPGEFLLISYRDVDKLYLPVDRLSLVQKYIGVEGHEPQLDRLGGKTWQATKKKVSRAIAEVAQELLELYAARKIKKGHAFAPPSAVFREFEASFPYEETPDQAAAIDEVLSDMQSERPMDRLVCGDAGYGKTEVALRATMLAVSGGRQVAILVPTTLLAEQHFRTFSSRLGPFGVRVAGLSRLKSPKEQRKILADLKAGVIDVIIGTHRLLQADVGFKDLGLIIIDEEHRFGVRHKERLKKLKSTVDVLTLTATPIPRTLQLSLLGVRDLSVINTPPGGRLPVKTYIAKFEEPIVREAIRREIRRGGQVFFVHNRIKGIHSLADYLRRLVPEARIEVAHGQMPSEELERIMIRFLRHEIDVLVSTTIIESGLDIPNANTIIINRADRLGLAEIYQLRGRVGRSSDQAYCYLLVPSLNDLSEEARKRLRALMDFSELGAGFKLALSDLQIRGAGNLLGTSQSGHIAAVGYDLYLEILQRTVEELKGKAPEEDFEPEVNFRLPAFIPQNYITEVEQRLLIYRRLALCRDENRVSELEEELEDRYGPLPEEVRNLFRLQRLKLHLRRLKVKRLDRTDHQVVLSVDQETKIDPETVLYLAKRRKGVRLSPEGRLFVRLPGREPFEETISILEELEHKG